MFKVEGEKKELFFITYLRQWPTKSIYVAGRLVRETPFKLPYFKPGL
jgi:hypothetical protein